MYYFRTIGLCLPILFLTCISVAEVRHIDAQKDQIITVKTAVGIATIVQVPDRPTSVVIGDQSVFQVEYLDKAITIKPLAYGARTNLYVYTDWNRYNIKLVPSDKNQADYVVYLKTKAPKAETHTIKWRDFKNNLRNSEMQLNVHRLGSTRNGLYLVEFHVNTNKKETFKPDWLWLTQNGRTVPIHRLAMNELKLKPNNPVGGMLVLRKEDLNTELPLKLEMRREKISYLTIKEPQRW